MKSVVIGGTGLIGSKLVNKLREHGHETVAAAPNAGMSTSAIANQGFRCPVRKPRYRQVPPKGIKGTDDGYFYIDPVAFHADFAADLHDDQAAFMAASQVLISADSFTHKVTNPAWKSKPSWYMVATEDRSINPDQERMMAKRMNAKTIEVKSSHVAYMSHPKETAKLIQDAATSVRVDAESSTQPAA